MKEKIEPKKSELDGLMIKPEACKIYESELTMQIFTVYLNSEIANPQDYTDLLALLRNAPENAQINMYLNSIGGNLFSAVQIINAMNDSYANITTIIDGECHSAASVIFLNGDNFIVKPGGCMLCHFYSMGTSGKGNEVKSSINFHDEYCRADNIRNYNGFLSDKELDLMFKGKDIWLNEDEIRARLKKMIKVRGPKEFQVSDVITYPESK